jgi:phenolic acid decarboxylase
LTQDHRYSEYSTKPGERHDITIDMEKKTEMPDGKWVKDEKVSDAEKSELIKALEKIEHVAWAGPTPHGVHCGIYFK